MLTVLLRATYSDFVARLPSNGYLFFELWGVTMNAAAIANEDYILVSEKDQGFEAGSFFTGALKDINHYIADRPGSFQLVERFSLPNGDVIIAGGFGPWAR